uniref:Uncharacterized protein n=1 Tax=Ciona intestinalis TaxID=7719 RepID=H2XTU6_CIOIN
MHEKNTTCVSSCLGNIAIKMAVICALSFTLSSFVVVRMKMNKQEENIDGDVVITQLLLAPLLLLFVFVRNPNVLFCSTSLCLGILSMLLTTLSRHYWQHSDATAPYKVSAMTSLAAYVITSLVSTLQPEQSSKITSTRRLKTIIAWLQTTLFLGYILSISAYQDHTNLISLPNVFALLTFVGFLFFAIVVAYEEFNQPSISKGWAQLYI